MGEPETGQIMPVFPADDRRMIEPAHDVFTPHMSLVPHLPGGSVRVLASANYDSGHWPLELKQHLDMELTAVYTRSRTPFGFPSGWSGMRAADVTVRLLQALFRHFAVKISETKFTILPEVVHAPPREHIAAGAGFVGYLDRLDCQATRPRRKNSRRYGQRLFPSPGCGKCVLASPRLKSAAISTLRLRYFIFYGGQLQWRQQYADVAAIRQTDLS